MFKLDLKKEVKLFSKSKKQKFSLSKLNQPLFLQLFIESIDYLSVSKIVYKITDIAPKDFSAILVSMRDRIDDGGLAFESLRGVYPHEITELLIIAEKTGDNYKIREALLFGLETLQSSTSKWYAQFTGCFWPAGYYVAVSVMSIVMSKSLLGEESLIDLDSPDVPFIYRIFVYMPQIHFVIGLLLAAFIITALIFFKGIAPRYLGKSRSLYKKNPIFQFYDTVCSANYWRILATLSTFDMQVLDRLQIARGSFMKNPYMSKDLSKMISRIDSGQTTVDSMYNTFVTRDSLNLFASLDGLSKKGEAGCKFAQNVCQFAVQSVLGKVSFFLTTLLWSLVTSTLLITVPCLMLISSAIDV